MPVSMPAPAPAPALALERITCTFAARPGVKGGNAAYYTAVKDTSLSVAAGEFVSVVGPTGCGKSTLLNVAAGLLAPSAGSVRIDGATLSGINERAGYMFQADALMPWRSALANVRAGLEFHGAAKAEATSRAREWLTRVGLAGFEDRFPHQLSGGMRKRVALAQMLILDPQLLLMDEPFAALDVQTRQLMENELLDLWHANRKSVLFITHDLEEAISLSDRVDRAFGRACYAYDRGVRDRSAASARCCRYPDDAALCRAASGHLAAAEGRSHQRLCAKQALNRDRDSRSTMRCCSAPSSRSGTR